MRAAWHDGDPYRILGILPDATQREVRRAYRSLAKRFHPDKNPKDPSAEERFKEIQWAYEELSMRKSKKAGHGPSKTGYRTTFSGEPAPAFHGFFSAMRAFYGKGRGGAQGKTK